MTISFRVTVLTRFESYFIPPLSACPYSAFTLRICHQLFVEQGSSIELGSCTFELKLTVQFVCHKFVIFRSWLFMISPRVRDDVLAASQYCQSLLFFIHERASELASERNFIPPREENNLILIRKSVFVEFKNYSGPVHKTKDILHKSEMIRIQVYMCIQKIVLQNRNKTWKFSYVILKMSCILTWFLSSCV